MTTSRHRILIAVDGSPASLRAASLAIDLARVWDAEVRAVAVAGDEGAEHLLGRAGERSVEERRQSGLEYALEHVSRHGARRGVAVETVVRVGKGVQPYELILEEATHWNANLLFVGRRSHRGLGRALLGSQTEHILEFARVPVMVVPAETSGVEGVFSLESPSHE